MDADLVSLYVSEAGQSFRIGYGTLDELRVGTFHVDDDDFARWDALRAEVARAAAGGAPVGAE